MTKTASSRRTIVVSGDVTMDWNLARTGDGGESGRDPSRTRACWQRGGAALLGGLVRAIAEGGAEAGPDRFEVRQTGAPADGVCPSDASFAHSYVMWDQHDAVKPRGGERSPQVWRVGKFMGVDPAAPASGAADAAWKRVVDDAHDAGLVVLDDAGLGFRERPELWPLAVTSAESRPWVLLKMSRPLAQGPLWERLVGQHADRLIVVANIADLRRGGAALGKQLSWERTAAELVRELACNPVVNALSQAAHVVVLMPTSGALLCSRARSARESASRRLFFDRFGVEWAWAKDRPGRMMGYTACFTACLARELMVNRETPDISKGVREGLMATRRLHEVGYGVPGATATDLTLAFPTRVLTETWQADSKQFAETELPPACVAEATGDGQGDPWTILGSSQSARLHDLAVKTLLEGPEAALPGVPIGRFGKLITVDRREIEGMLSVRALMEEYLRWSGSSPLSIAVFGPPGSGKSFGVEQIADSLLSSKDSVLKFNLTQLSGEKDLIGAFHQVRDRALSGKTPLVFWDEFDTAAEGRPLAWLARFLAPMQDGAFQEGQITHPIGRAIFVFAGGISASMQLFDKGRDDPAFKDAKGPDFVSRLKGYLNVLGPNRQGGPAEDQFFVIRRAILLRSLLLRREPGLFSPPGDKGKLNIDSRVLRALLHVPSYRHGVRSMESVIAMSSLTGRTRFDRACLPPESQAELHVDGKEFRKLVEQFEVEGELLEKLARAAHEAFCEGKKRDGWTFGPRDNVKLTHPLLKDYAELDETYKEANRTTVRNIPRKLAAGGYAMTPVPGAAPPFVFTADEIERMAEVEHELWMADRLAAGFTLGKETSTQPKRSPYLVPWNDVPEDIKVIDRDLVKAMPGILARAGFAVRRV